MTFEDPGDNELVALLHSLRTHDVPPRRAARLRADCRLQLTRQARGPEAAKLGVATPLMWTSVLYAGAVLVRTLAFYAR